MRSDAEFCAAAAVGRSESDDEKKHAPVAEQGDSFRIRVRRARACQFTWGRSLSFESSYTPRARCPCVVGRRKSLIVHRRGKGCEESIGECTRAVRARRCVVV